MMSDVPPNEQAPRFEPRDVPPLLPLWLAGGLAGFVALVFFVIWAGFPLANHQEYRGPMKALPRAPRLEIAPVGDRVRYEEAKQRELSRERIEAAMVATARQGWSNHR
jgi:hypothetical protein